MRKRTVKLEGKKFGRWTVIERAAYRVYCTFIDGSAEWVKDRKVMWKCVCDCGNLRVVQGTHLVKGKSKSCGCIRKKIPISEELK